MRVKATFHELVRQLQAATTLQDSAQLSLGLVFAAIENSPASSGSCCGGS